MRGAPRPCGGFWRAPRPAGGFSGSVSGWWGLAGGGGFAEDAVFAFFGCAGEAGLGGVEVAFGDRGLGVACAVLEVDVGVACGGLVGERGMPEVVEGPEAWVDVGVVEGLAHVAGELGGVGRAPVFGFGKTCSSSPLNGVRCHQWASSAVVRDPIVIVRREALLFGVVICPRT